VCVCVCVLFCLSDTHVIPGSENNGLFSHLSNTSPTDESMSTDRPGGVSLTGKKVSLLILI